jgi:photosystem II stability/assembly factor-like uncharacterized protein
MCRLASQLLLLAALAACDTPDRPAQLGAATPIPPAAGAAVPGISPAAAPSPAPTVVPAPRTPGLITPSGGSPAAGPATGDGPAQPPTADLPTLPPLPTPPSPSAADGPDVWAHVAAQVAFPLYVPGPDSGLVIDHGPWPGQFPLEAGGPGTYSGVAATYRAATTGEPVTVVQIAGWPGDKERFGVLIGAGDIVGFYYEDAIQRRLIFQPNSPDHATDIMLRVPVAIGRDSLFALAAGMQRVPAATPSAAVSQIRDLSFADTRHGWVLQTRCRGDARPCDAFILVTTDGGQTWPTRRPAPAGDLRAIRLVSAQDGWIYGPGGWFGTHDGGVTWQAGPAGGQILRVQPVGQALWAIQQACPAPNNLNCALRLLRSLDGGRAWDAPPAPAGLRGLAALVAGPGDDAWLVVDQDPGGTDTGLLLASHDGGQIWQPRAYPCPPALSLRHDLATAPGRLWMVCAGYPGAGQVDQDKSLYRSTDDGQHWVRVAHHDFGAAQPDERAPAAGDLPLMATWGLTAAAPDRLWMILSGGWLSRSADGGRSWHQVDLPYGQISDYGLGPLVFLDAAHGWVAGRSGLFRTTDGGEHWETITLP